MGNEIIDNRESLIQSIKADINNEYQILNKFSTEKFSVILLLIGLLGIFVTIWPVLSKYVSFSSLLYYWFLGTFVLLIVWISSIIGSVRNFIKNKQKNNLTFDFFKNYSYDLVQNFIRLIKKNGNCSEEETPDNFESFFHRYTNQLYILVDYISKNTETRMKPVILSLIFLVMICLIHFNNYFYVSILSFEQFLPLTHTSLIIPVLVYSIIFVIVGVFWNYALKIAQVYFGLMGCCTSFMIKRIDNYYQKVEKVQKLWRGGIYRNYYIIQLIIFLFIGLSILLLLLSLLALITIFIFVFPFIVLISEIFNNLMSYTPNLIVNFFISIVVMFIFFKVLEILFSIHLVEQIKNDKITWLKWLNIEIYNDGDLSKLQEKYLFSDVYMPISYPSLWAFTRYEILPISLYKDPEFLRERLDFMKKHK